MSGEFAAGFLTCAVAAGLAVLVWAAVADGIAMYRQITRSWKS